MIDFKDMPYERPDLEALKQEAQSFTEALRAAATYEEAKQVFLQREVSEKHLSTLMNLANPSLFHQFPIE